MERDKRAYCPNCGGLMVPVLRGQGLACLQARLGKCTAGRIVPRYPQSELETLPLFRQDAQGNSGHGR